MNVSSSNHTSSHSAWTVPSMKIPKNTRSRAGRRPRCRSRSEAATAPSRNPNMCAWKAMPAHAGSDGPLASKVARTIGSVRAV